MSWSQADVEAALRRVGLDPDAFDLAAAGRELEERSALNETLDALVGGHVGLDPASRFDARWAS